MKTKGIVVLIAALVFLSWPMLVQAEKDKGDGGGKARSGGQRSGGQSGGGGKSMQGHSGGGGGPPGGGGGGQQIHRPDKMPGAEHQQGPQDMKKFQGKGQDQMLKGKGQDQMLKGKSQDQKLKGKGQDQKLQGKGQDQTLKGKSQDQKLKGKGPQDQTLRGKGPDKSVQGKGGPGLGTKPGTGATKQATKQQEIKKQAGQSKGPPAKTQQQTSVQDKRKNAELHAKMYPKEPSSPKEKAELHKKMDYATRHFDEERAGFTHRRPGDFDLSPRHAKFMDRHFGRYSHLYGYGYSYSYSSYCYSRSVFYAERHYREPWYIGPYFYPYYGPFDPVYLDYALATVFVAPVVSVVQVAVVPQFEPTYLAFFYGHWDDDEIIEWRQTVERIDVQEAQTEENRQQIIELQRNVASLNATIADMKAKNVHRDTDFIPPNDDDKLFAVEAIEAYQQQQAKASTKM